MGCVIRILCAADESWCSESGHYVRDFDVGAHDGLGPFPVTKDITEAKVFSNASVALQFWSMQSRIRPLRPDNKPNRPLTAFTVEIVNNPSQRLEIP